MQREPLSYEGADVQLYDWTPSAGSDDCAGVFTAADGDRFALCRVARRDIEVSRADERWLLRDRLLGVDVRSRRGGDSMVAMLRRRLLGRSEVRFHDGTLVHLKPLRSFRVTTTAPITFINGRETLVVVRKLLGRKRVRLETTAAGMRFSGRMALCALGLYELVRRGELSDG